MKNTQRRFSRSLILALMIVAMLVNTTLAAPVPENIDVVYNSVNITVNGDRVSTDNFLYKDTTYVPLRAISEMLGKEVGWDGKTNTASISDPKEEIQKSNTDYSKRPLSRNTKNIEVVLNSVNVTVNGDPVSTDNFLYKGTTYVPLRAISEMLGKEVGWDGKTNTASINDLNDKIVDVGEVKVHFIDVGQGDSIFIELPNNQKMLIDGGTRSQGKVVSNYLNKNNVKKIDYLVATHPHEDHIGGLIEVVNNYNIGEIYMPKVAHTTKTFEDFLISIKTKNYKINPAISGKNILNKENLSLEILAPEDDTSDRNLNNHSVVIKLNHKENSFLFTGDAEKESELEMINKGYDLKSDVLKAGHHGSNTSSTEAFLDKVDPKYVVITCGIDNKYGHPNNETLNKFKRRGIKVLRTDLDGTIIAKSDGFNITFNKTPEIVPEEDKAKEVFITKTGSKYHRGNCSSLRRSKIPIDLEDAKKKYEPCNICKP